MAAQGGAHGTVGSVDHNIVASETGGNIVLQLGGNRVLLARQEGELDAELIPNQLVALEHRLGDKAGISIADKFIVFALRIGIQEADLGVIEEQILRQVAAIGSSDAFLRVGCGIRGGCGLRLLRCIRAAGG